MSISYFAIYDENSCNIQHTYAKRTRATTSRAKSNVVIDDNDFSVRLPFACAGAWRSTRPCDWFLIRGLGNDTIINRQI